MEIKTEKELKAFIETHSYTKIRDYLDYFIEEANEMHKALTLCDKVGHEFINSEIPFNKEEFKTACNVLEGMIETLENNIECGRLTLYEKQKECEKNNTHELEYYGHDSHYEYEICSK